MTAAEHQLVIARGHLLRASSHIEAVNDEQLKLVARKLDVMARALNDLEVEIHVAYEGERASTSE